MSLFGERPGLREQIASALSAKSLASHEGREGALERLGALGAAQIGSPEAPSLGAHLVSATVAYAVDPEPGATGVYAAEPGTVASGALRSVPAGAALDAERPGAPAPDPERAVREVRAHCGFASVARETPELVGYCAMIGAVKEARLSALLLRLKYAPGEHGRADEAVALFGRHLVHELQRNRGRTRASSRSLFIRVAEQAIAEWLAGSCPNCQGTGRRGVRMGGLTEYLVPCRACERKDARHLGTIIARIPGTGKDARITCPICCGKGKVIDRRRVRARLGTACGRCAGEGHFVPSKHERAAAIGVEPNVYQRHWQRSFDVALRALRALDRNLIQHLREQLERGINRAP